MHDLVRATGYLALTVALAPIATGGHSLGAQTLDATVRGVVRSEAGTPLLGVSVTFIRSGTDDPATGNATSTDERGRFSLRVPSGSLGTLRFVEAGHISAEHSVPPLTSGEEWGIGITLAALYNLAAISVVAPRTRPLLNTENAETGGTIEAVELRALPTDARDPLRLAFNVPGVSQSTGFFGDAPPLTIHGDNGLYTRYTLDGLDNNEGFLGGPRVQLPIGALERLDVHASVYRPAFGR